MLHLHALAARSTSITCSRRRRSCLYAGDHPRVIYAATVDAILRAPIEDGCFEALGRYQVGRRP